MTKVCLLATTPALYTTLAAEISNWVFQRSLEQWTVRVLKTSAPTAYDLRAELAAQAPFDHLFELGSLPQIEVLLGPDGHGLRWFPAPTYKVNRSQSIDNARQPGTDRCNVPAVIGAPYAHVGRLTFDGLIGLSEADVIDQYKRWFARRQEYTLNGCQNFPLKCLLLDHFDYVTPGGDDFREYGLATASQFETCPASFRRFTPLAINDDDGEIGKQEAALIYNVMSGGFAFGDGQYLDYWGHYYNIVNWPMQAAMVGFWGSHMCERDAGSIVRGALVDKPGAGNKSCKPILSAYSHAGNFSWRTVLAGGTAGQAATATLQAVGFDCDFLHGDPTTMADTPTIQNLALNERLTAVEAKQATMQTAITALQTTGPAGTGGNPDGGGTPPGPTVLAWNLGGATVGAFAAASAQGGSALNTQNTAAVSVAGVANAAPPAVYMTGWYRGSTFLFVATGIAPGKYTAVLHGEESWNSRSADWTVNGVLIPAVNWLNIAGAMHKAAVVSAEVTVGADGKLTVSGAWKSGDTNLWLCGIELKAAG